MKKDQLLISLPLLAVLTSCGLDIESKTNKRISPEDSDPANFQEKIINKGDRVETSFEVLKSENDIRDWHHKDESLNGLYGVSSDLAYHTFNLQQKREIVVAVIDSGVDHKHEDLKEVMWINKNEIPGNGIDDDKNGYIDDIYGWNFLGGKDGSHVNGETLEVTRIYKKFLDRIAAGEVLIQSDYKLYLEVKAEVEDNYNYFKPKFDQTLKEMTTLKSLLKKSEELLGKDEFSSKEEIEAIDAVTIELKQLKDELLALWSKYPRGGFERLAYLHEAYDYRANYYYNVNSTVRADIVGDNPDDFTDTQYGNNDVIGPDSSHGTHVAGTIAAKRDNGIGMNGLGNNVKIMALRAVPNGDERDKDIALAVRYAADNGAHIINMSFGKGYSPNKSEVDAAFKYAASKGVLLVHAAGNSSKNVDGGENNFPNSYVREGLGVLAVHTIPNWIEVGASTKDLGLNLPASFTNYGAEAVTVFAPGHKIYAPYPNNEYKAISGTSMACPVTSGVATMLLSEFPTMTAKEARAIILNTVTIEADGVEVRKPDPAAKPIDFRIPVQFSTLSSTGGVVNAFSAIRLAKRLAEENK